jgi:hypothetical protein
MTLNLHRNRLRSFTIKFVGRFLAVFILSSFLVTLLPIVSTSAEEPMPCCVGKAESHCDSGLLTPKPPPPKVTEPMCGLESVDSQSKVHSESRVHSLTGRIAETTSRHADAESNSARVTAESIGKPCQMDCGACATVTSRHKRQDLVLARITLQTPSTVVTHFNNSTVVYSSNENWTRISPRGPPSVL